nr:ubiquitin carboxyl-terminal proteinase - bovine (fragments) [Bos taurus]
WLPLEANPEVTNQFLKYEVFRSQGQDVTSSVYFMKAIANNKMHFESGSTLKFLEESASMSPEERYLENYDAIRVTHETSAHEGQTEAPNIDEKDPDELRFNAIALSAA